MSWTVTGTEKTPVDRFGIANVSLLLHGDGTNGSTTIIDSSPSPKTVTAVGNAQISTAQSKFGGASIAFDGTGDYLRPTTDGSPFAMGSGDWTVEGWIYVQSISTSQIIVDTLAASSPTVVGIRLRLTSGRALELWNYSSAIISGGTVPLQSWSHVVACRGAGTTRLFIDGAQAGSSFSDTQTYTCAVDRPLIGINAFDTSTLGFNGYIDDLRITKGIARYTANFTPPTAPFPDI
jgi:hypothetical protein